MVALPANTPFTTPLVPTVATDVLLLLHVPPAVVLPRVVALPAQTNKEPVIAAGKALTVKTELVEQPEGDVYVIAEVPAATAPTTPEALPTVATEVFALVHVPPVVVLAKVDEPPTQANNVPVLEVKRFTVYTALDKQPVDKV